jgi:hypothetical protein
MSTENTGIAISSDSLNQINANINVGIDDVVNVFVAQYENGLILERTSNQRLLQNLSKQIKEIETFVLESSKNFRLFSDAIGTKDLGLFTLTTSIDDKSFLIDWEKGTIRYTIDTKLKSNTFTGDNYNTYTSGSFYGQMTIGSTSIVEYREAMAAKSRISAILAEINNSLRDVSRKERAIRGKIAEQKLTSMGMTDLLNNPQLLQLVDLSNLGD